MIDPLRERVSAAIGHQYSIAGEIGRGGMSVVYRAHDLRLNRDVAIKVLPPELAHDAAVGSRFTREAQTSAQLAHPHIVPIFDVGERDGIAYFVMALVTGGNLATHLERQSLRSIEEVRRILAEVADALAYAYVRGVIHRDIKADNILIDAESGRAMVTDFGIARAMESGARLTQTGIAVGTPTYMSPEQAVGERELDGRSDVYSLGVVGYQMLTGRVPFSAANSMALLLKHVSEPPRPILELRPETPRALAEAVERALAKSPESRWPTAAAFREAIVLGEASPSWRSERRDAVRYASPIPRSRRDVGSQPLHSSQPARATNASAASTSPSSAKQTDERSARRIELEPAHLAALTPAQRADLLLWNGRVNLLDRVKFARRYAWATGGMIVLGIIGFVAGVDDVPPLVVAPVVPLYMMFKLRKRSLSLRDAGLRLRRVYLRLRATSVIPVPHTGPSERQLEKLVSRAVLQSPYGSVVRRAAAERAAIAEVVASMSKADRALVPDIDPTVASLFDRVVSLAQALHRLDGDVDPALLAELNERIAALHESGSSFNDSRPLDLLRRQRDTLQELADRRTALARQLENAALMLGNLRLDLIKLRSSGLESALRDVSAATQEARALSREIGSAIDIAAEVREL